MSAPQIVADIAIEAEGWAALNVEAITEEVIAAIVRARPDGVRGGEVSVLFTDDAEVHGLNKEWRDKDKPTNVLSFPAEEMDLPADVPQPLGDLALALETCLAEATEKAISPKDHLSHLILHGLLHLFGYDHIDEDEATEMEALEIALLAGLGIRDPYAIPAHDGESDA